MNGINGFISGGQKTKRFAFAILIITTASVPAQAKYSGGTGTPDDPYQIATAEDLNDIGNHE
jgi:hypothetical protein